MAQNLEGREVKRGFDVIVQCAGERSATGKRLCNMLDAFTFLVS